MLLLALALSCAPVPDALAADTPAGFTRVEVGPFVILGDEPPATVRDRAQSLVVWSRDRLRAEYGWADPPGPVNVWLFRNASSYNRNVAAMLTDYPDTPYGFANDEGLFMNISTGGGTLVHELVHPYIFHNIPGAGPWFNEGLASLYEACADEDGRIVGLVNWRLPELQGSLKAGTTPSFRDLAAMDPPTFYGPGSGVSYGEARYLFYWLQEKGLLQQLVAAYTARGEDDPEGYAALLKTLGVEDEAEVRAEWETFVLGLRPR
ncbi:MAG: hypothetical protein H6739_20460 [Alphaproteobacteria bacterium]|nr:hypothetical protein [Alphaproteobacteria bacterium]